MSNEFRSLSEKTALRDYFSGFVTERRFALFNQVILNRTRYLSLVLEDIYQPHNASAVLRSCDCFGVQDVHIIENRNVYEVNPDVALGSTKWLSMKRYNRLENNTAECLQQLKSQGYRIVATTPRIEAPLLEDFDLKKGKIALMFGTEQEGLSPEALQLAHEQVRIPMYGFTESFNISVSAALCLFHFTAEVRKQGLSWQLTDEEVIDIQLDWFRNTIKDCELLEKIYRQKNN